MKSFGSLDYQKGQWLIEAEPHVALRLKRIFPKISRRSHGVLKISDSPDAAREIEWFCERFPLEPVSAEVGNLLRQKSAAHLEQESLVAALLAGTRPPTAFPMALPPREYQRVAADLALATGGLLCADDLGLGKTCVAIAALTDPRTRPALVVTLTHLPRQWEAELRKFAPHLRAHVLKKGTPYDIGKPKRSRKGQLALTPEVPDVIITNYHKLSGWAETLAPVIRGIVFDEAQELRRGTESAKGSAAAHLARGCFMRLGLTATPIYNYGNEIWELMNIIRPGALGTSAEFREEWCGGYSEKVSEPKVFGAFLRSAGYMLRRTRSEVGRELPPLTNVVHHVESDSYRLEQVETAATELARVILTQNPTGHGEKFRAAEELSNLVRQATGIAKAPYVAAVVDMLVESGQRVVLYGWHREVYSIWLERLKRWSPAMYTGSESVPQKDEAKRRFVSGETPILIMSLRSGAGLDGLQGCCNSVVFGELDWSPGVHEQCAGRVHRDGQEQPVMAYYLVSDEGSDPIVLDVLGVKSGQIAGVRDPEAEAAKKLEGGGAHVQKLAAAYLAKREMQQERLLEAAE